MKYSKDFITNSSSSSFIGVFAQITDLEKAKKVIDKYDLHNGICNTNSLKWYDEYKISFNHDFCDVDLLDGKDITEIQETSNWFDLFLEWHSYNDWYDSDFRDYEDCDLSDFSEREIEIFNSICKENGFEIIGSGYGAGYNG